MIDLRYLVAAAFLWVGMLNAAYSQSSILPLLARDAKVSSGLRIHDEGEEKATIHGWNAPAQRISWKTQIPKGRYKVLLRYAEPYQGSAISLVIGNQELTTLIKPTASWTDYQTNALGVIEITKNGEHEVILQGVQLALIKNEDGKLAHEEALPDVHELQLVAVKEKATSSMVDVLKNFKGKKLFDGKTFKGWEGNNGEETFKWFRIEEECIVGGTMEKPIPKNEFLRTAKTYQNFELRYQFKMTFPEETGSWNAGVQFRSQKHPEIPNEMVGYQADAIPWKWGAVWDEQRRWQFLGTPLQEAPHDNDGWNTEIVRCEGSRIRVWLNGVLTLDYTEPFTENPHPDQGIIPMDGYIALQLHEDKNPVEVRYRNIEIQELK